MPELMVNVTQEDIDRGEPRRACRCPVALSLARSLSVPVATAGYYQMCAYLTSIPTPEVAKSFMAKFDSGDRPPPFSFPITWPDPLPAGEKGE